jgi:hypothetical protein
MRVGGQLHAPAALPPGKRPSTHFIGGWVAPEPVWTGAENLAPTGIRSPDRPARSESLYRLRYPALIIRVPSYISFTTYCLRWFYCCEIYLSWIISKFQPYEIFCNFLVTNNMFCTIYYKHLRNPHNKVHVLRCKQYVLNIIILRFYSP